MKIRVFCNAGMSTSMLVTKIRKVATDKGIDLDIIAYPFDELRNQAEGSDVVLLGPQIGYEEKNVKAYLDPKGIPCGVIPMVDYGMMNGEKVLAFALNLIKK